MSTRRDAPKDLMTLVYICSVIWWSTCSANSGAAEFLHSVINQLRRQQSPHAHVQNEYVLFVEQPSLNLGGTIDPLQNQIQQGLNMHGVGYRALHSYETDPAVEQMKEGHNDFQQAAPHNFQFTGDHQTNFQDSDFLAQYLNSIFTQNGQKQPYETDIIRQPLSIDTANDLHRPAFNLNWPNFSQGDNAENQDFASNLHSSPAYLPDGTFYNQYPVSLQQYPSHQHPHAMMDSSDHDVYGKKPAEPLFVAMAGFVGVAMIFMSALILLPKIFAEPPDVSNLKKGPQELAALTKVAVEAIEGKDCTERIACEVSRAMRSLQVDTKPIKMMEVVLPTNMSKQLAQIRKALITNQKCKLIQCKQIHGQNKKKTT